MSVDSYTKVVDEFNMWSSHYDHGVSHYFFDLCERRIVRTLSLNSAVKILDVGCGTGNLLLTLQKLNKNLFLYGIDLSGGMIRTAMSKFQTAKNVFLEIGVADSLPFSKNFFDYVVCSNSLHHHPDFKASLSEMTRILKPGGRLILVDGIIDGWTRRLYFSLLHKIQNESNAIRLTKKIIYHLFEEFGYKKIVQEEILYFNLLTYGDKI